MKNLSMRKSKMHFEQIRVEEARKIAKREKAAARNLIREPATGKTEPYSLRLASRGRQE